MVRFGTRVAGRDGVQTLKVEDDRIKCVFLCFNFSLSIAKSMMKVLFENPFASDAKFSSLLTNHFRYEGLHHGSSYLEHLNFLTAIRAKGEQAPAVDLQDGLVSVAIGVAAQLSIEKGRFVTIEEVLGGLSCNYTA